MCKFVRTYPQGRVIGKSEKGVYFRQTIFFKWECQRDVSICQVKDRSPFQIAPCMNDDECVHIPVVVG